MNVVDSSCWLEFFAGSEVGDIVAPVIEDIDNLLIPTIILYEVFKKLLIETNEDQALFAIAHMKQGKIVELDENLSIFSAKVGKDNHLALADSIIYATCLREDAFLFTQDKHFKNLLKVNYYEKR